MYFSRLVISFVSMSVAPQIPHQHGNVYFCEQGSEYKNPFPHPAVLAQQSTPLQTGIDLMKVIPPPEFQRLIKARAVGPRTSFWPPLWPPQGCELAHTNGQHSFH
jgi:hypothetical protein